MRPPRRRAAARPFVAAAALVAALSGLSALADDAPPKADGEATEPSGETAERGGEELPPPPPPKEALTSIKAKEAKSHLYYLASNKLKGRASGLEGANLAADYLVKELKEYGYEPAGDGEGEYQSFKQTMQIRVLPFPGQPQRGGDNEAKGQMADTYNVCGLLRGTDEELKDEYVVLSAHYDHVGARSKKRIYNGADDNASGTSALLEVAQAFTVKGVPRPRRSILILFFTAEERGLLGSKHYANKPTVPISDIVCDLNIDMVGRNDAKEMHVYGNACSPDLDAAHIRAAEISGLRFLAKTGSIFLRSDQVNFYRKNIPCLFWTSGLHKDYHSTKDEAKRIVTSKLQRAARHAFATAWEVAHVTQRPRFVKMDANASTGPLGAVIDMMPAEDVPYDKMGADDGAVLVRSVMDGSPAKEAKLAQGDIIIGLGGKPLPGADPVGALEAAAQEKKQLVLRVLRGKRKLKVTIKL